MLFIVIESNSLIFLVLYSISILPDLRIILSHSIHRLEELSDIDLANSYIQQVGTADLKELEVVETLGRGSESMVYKAKLKGGNKFFALKLLKKINGKKIKKI